jgi:uncharacterized protein (DUF486 family)
VTTIYLLLLSKVSMPFAWYGYLKYGHDCLLWQAVLVAGGIRVFFLKAG